MSIMREIPNDRPCQTCGTWFTPYRPNGLFCSRKCKPRSKSKKFVPGACSVCSRFGKLRKGLCTAHYEQVRRKGAITNEVRQPFSGPLTETPTYRTVHNRLEASRGKASQHDCEECSEQARDWSFDNAEPQWIEPRTGLAYHDDLGRYRPLCRKCHIEVDAKGVSA